MNYPFQCFTAETYQLLKKLHRDGSISNTAYQEMEDFQYSKNLMKLLEKNFAVSYQTYGDKIWKKIRQGWYWDRESKKVCTVFSKVQSIFVEKLLINGGIYPRSICLVEMLTAKQIDNNIPELEEWGIIIKIGTRKNCGFNTIYIIHPELVRKIKID